MQVGCLGDVEQDGVVGALAVLGDEAQGAVAIYRCFGDNLPEDGGADVVRAAEGGENASHG